MLLLIDADDFFEEESLFGYVTEETAKLFNGWHYYMPSVILGMVILQMLVIYLVWKKENLIKPMFNNWKWVREKDRSQ